MGNYNNIKPYSDFSHKVAPYGGPGKYVEKVAKDSFEEGVQTEKATELGKGICVLVGGIAIWEGGKLIFSKIINHRQSKLNMAKNKADKSQKECVEVLKNAIEDENNNISEKVEKKDNQIINEEY
ncbi:MAG: hypothetical protein K6G88_10625 [Lachnospiraceae bacterium]|nr:hypothetical protein [Lachnospiraceae bacterium]